MKRIMMIDDERPVLDGMKLMIRRDLASEFEIVGTASSGREAIEKVTALAPEIVLMDVSMPGITGLEAIREIRKRGINPVFILVTAYERFDIAREAVELGVVDYLLKPVSRDKLAVALRAAASHIDQKGQLTQREYEFREREEALQVFVETAFLQGIMLGEDRSGSHLDWRAALAGSKDFGVVFCVAFLGPAGMGNGSAEIANSYRRYLTAMRFKTRALVGPLVSGRSLALIWLRDAEAAGPEFTAFRDALQQVMAVEMSLGLVRLGCGTVQPANLLSLSWYAALRDLGGNSITENSFDFDTDSAFLDQILSASPGQARLELDRILAELEALPTVAVVQRFRVISLLGSACRQLIQRGLLEPNLAGKFLDFSSLEAATSGSLDGIGFCLLTRAWFNELAACIGSLPTWSAPVAKTVAWIRENYGMAISLDVAAELTGISISRLSKLFIAETGQGFSEFLIKLRIEKAKEFLSKPGASIKQVSVQCGYPDPNYFARLFKKETGSTPSAWAVQQQESEYEA